MKKYLYFILAVALFFLVGLLTPNSALATEGTFEIRSTTRDQYYCWGASLYMPYNKYRLIVGCADLVYPPIPREAYKFYMLWANPIDNSKPMRLGQLGGGTGEFHVIKPFDELFVTLEYSDKTKDPSNIVVMRGVTQPIQSLLRRTTPTPTPTIEASEESTPTSEEAVVDTSELSTREKLVLALKRAGIAAVIALVVIVGLVFVVSRSRG